VVAAASLRVAIAWALTTALVIITDRADFHSGWNAIWMIGIPFAVSRLLDRGQGLWPLGGLYLLVLNTVAMSVTAVLLGIGP